MIVLVVHYTPEYTSEAWQQMRTTIYGPYSKRYTATEDERWLHKHAKHLPGSYRTSILTIRDRGRLFSVGKH